MDQHGSYSYRDANIYQNQKRSVERELRESLRRIPLAHMIREFMVAGTTANNYIIPDKLADVLYRAAQPIDIAPLVSADVINGWHGGDLTVDITDRYSLKARRAGSGGSRAPRTPTTTQATLSPVAFSAPLVAESSMIEDAQYALVEWHARQAAHAIADLSNDLILDVLKTATDGVGTVNSSATGDADETKYTGGATSDILVGWSDLGPDHYVGDTLICTPEAWQHSISQSTTAGTMDAIAPVQVDTQFDVKLATLNLDVLFSTSDSLHDAADDRGAAMTECVSIIFDRTAALLTGRKRWMLIEDYADPVRDLEGAVVSARQDSVTLYDDAIYVLTET
jgi:hypothetical protein